MWEPLGIEDPPLRIVKCVNHSVFQIEVKLQAELLECIVDSIAEPSPLKVKPECLVIPVFQLPVTQTHSIV